MTNENKKESIVIEASDNDENSGFYKVKSPTRGGLRVGAGRPKGSTNKIRVEDLMNAIELAVGQSFEQQLAENYVEAINRADWNKVLDYDKALLNKIVADKTEVEVITNEDAVEAKAEAFAEALRLITNQPKKD